MNQLTDKTKCLLTREGIEIWITDKQAEIITERINDEDSNDLIEVGDDMIATRSISGIYSSKKIQELRRKKQGWWQCELCHRWHPREEQCGCQGGRY